MTPEFIREFKYTAQQAGAKYGIPTEVVLATIWRESDGLDVGTNSKGYTGLMQVGKTAFADVQKYYGKDGILGTNTTVGSLTYADMNNQTYNIWVGTAYLRIRAGYEDGTIHGSLTGYSGYMAGYADNVLENANIMTPGCVSATSMPSDGTYKAAVAAASAAGKSTTANTLSTANLATIMNFASFTQSLAFKNMMETGFTRSMQDTLHSYLSSFMAKFYHNLYYVPTLPDNRAILVKPECLFIEPPACNVIYPTLKSDLSFSRDPKSEPTRIVSISNPVANIFGDKGANNALTQLITMAFMDYKKDEVTKKYTTETEVTSLNAMSLAYGEADKKHPQYNMTLYEKDNGIRILTECKGEDLYLFLLANGNDGKKQNGYMVPDSANKKDIGLVLEVLAKYALLRARYEPRVGSCTTIPNPYIVPGFPMLSVEGSADSSLNVYAYVDSVTHSITEGAWSTSVGFRDTHIYNEPRPPIFPIAEAEYTNNIDKTYTDMLGANMTKVNKLTGPADCRKAYVESDGTTDAMLRRIWRPLTTMEQHLKDICDGATVVEEPKYTWFKNASSKKFFNEDVQAKIKAYTSDILEGIAFTELDVR